MKRMKAVELIIIVKLKVVKAENMKRLEFEQLNFFLFVGFKFE